MSPFGLWFVPKIQEDDSAMSIFNFHFSDRFSWFRVSVRFFSFTPQHTGKRIFNAISV